MSALADLISPVEEREWLGWPQFGMVRPAMPDRFCTSIVRRTELGDPVYWKQRDRFAAPVEITKQEHAELAAAARSTFDPYDGQGSDEFYDRANASDEAQPWPAASPQEPD